jgi:putative ABC transport system substrate-binding protein
MLALGAGALAVPIASFSRGRRTVRVAYLSIDTDRDNPLFRAFTGAMRELGWTEGANVEARFHASGGRDELFAGLAEEVVRANVDVIVTVNSGSTRAAMKATNRIPIVFGSAANPVEQRLVASLARPGGNVTGLALLVRELGPKRLELLKEIAPRARRFARLYQATSLAEIQADIIAVDNAAARKLGIELEHVSVSAIDDIEPTMHALARRGIDAVHVTGAPLFVVNRAWVARLALDHRIPLMCPDSRFTEAGALASYGENQVARFRALALMVDKVLRGASPAEMPVEQPTTFELVLNMQTASALGLTLSDAVRLRASRVVA